MEDVNLNDKTNLNPSINKFEGLPDDDKRKMISDWENRPGVKEHNIGGYDKKREVAVGKTQYGLWKFLAFISTLSLLIIAGVIGYSFYYNYNTYHEIALFPKQTCAPVINIPTDLCPKLPVIPACPAAPDCVLTCGTPNVTLVPNITVNVPVHVVNSS